LIDSHFISKSYNGRITKWVWDGNVILHEWVEHFDDVNEDDEIPDSLQSDEISAVSLQAQLDGRPSNGPPESGELPLPTTWLFDPDTFAPASKIVGDNHYSIISDHLGTPLSMFDETGVQTWSAELDIYGAVKGLQGDRSDCPFRYPGQYEDCEIGLYYNRFRYYDPDGGEYVSQDPIGLFGGNPNHYAYVNDTNFWVDVFGLAKECSGAAKVPTKITAYTKHGLNQAIGRNGGRGVSAKAILDAVKNPKSISQQANGTFKFIGKKATVILNEEGKVITTFGKSRGPQIWLEGTARTSGSGSAQRIANKLGFSYWPGAIR
jgi:RHS repeat-associated protein